VGRPALRSADVLATFRADLDRHRRLVLEQWRRHGDEVLAARPAPGKWSAVDCVEHVRRANAMYLRHMERAIAGAEERKRRPVETFHPGAIGERMRRSLEPKPAAPAADGRPGIRMRVKTFGGYDPVKDASPPDPAETLQRFGQQLDRMKALAERMERVDLHVRTNTLLGPLLRLRIGDVARYLVAHADRHFVQAERAMAGAESARS
jgi:hypothetical protein